MTHQLMSIINSNIISKQSLHTHTKTSNLTVDMRKKHERGFPKFDNSKNVYDISNKL